MRTAGEPSLRRSPVPPPRRRRRGRRWRRLSVTLAVVITIVVLLVDLTSGSAPPTGGRASADHRGGSGTAAAGRHGGTSASSSSSSSAPGSTAPPAPTTTTTSPGTLPQTNAFPSATSPQFEAEMADLWQGVVTGDVGPAMPSFFPLGAYRQLKAIPNATTDWHQRLVGDFRLDVAAAHALLGTGAASATLVRVDVPAQYGHWVVPGVCYNSIGYYEVPNARVVYDEGGVTRSFGIASMISWRGQWYVVHLGAVLRTTPSQGLVDAPATGPGTSAYSSTC